MSRPVTIGPFELHRRIGHGGMGEVWAGVHVAQNYPVAVKVLTQAGARRRTYNEAFRNEVRGLAGLDHPGIVTILDYGEIPEEAALASEGLFAKSSPYIVMELGERGSLAQYLDKVGWPEVRDVLFALLDALGYAHAAGVIHRDLKPANVLVGCGPSRRQIKLTDFGLAHAFDRHEFGAVTDSGWGTPQFMAPEQFRGAWREYGPWTDLYALGVMAYYLCVGQYPYYASDYAGWARAHQLGDVPMLEPRFGVPEGFDGWVERLLQRDPAHRFQFAADAAWALQRLGDPVVAVPSSRVTMPMPLGFELPAWELAPVDPTSELTHEPGETVVDRPPTTKLVADVHGRLPQNTARMKAIEHSPAPRAGKMSDDVPPLPVTWDRELRGERHPQLLGVGLGLFGLRTVPIVNRMDERDYLWERLREVRETGISHAVVVRGNSGTGKSRLARWLTRRAHEVGAARVLKVAYSPISGPGDGLARMVAQQLRAGGLDTRSTLDRVEVVMRRHGVRDTDEVTAMARFIMPLAATSPELRTPGHRVQRPNARYHVLFNYLRRLGEERPVVVWFDDVQWGADALAFVRFVLERQHHSHLPVLFVLTARNESLIERSIENGLLGDLSQNRRCTVLPVEPLEEGHLAELVGDLLNLSPGLSAYVRDRSAGNPLVAVQMVGDWVAGGRLVVGDDGFEFHDGVVIDDDEAVVDDLWRERLAMLLRRRPVDDQVALEIAAALGNNVDVDEWSAACAKFGVSLHPGLARDLLEAGLMSQAPYGLEFCHGLFRERLEQMSDTDSRRYAIHEACLSMLEELYTDKKFPFAERCAHHLLAAQRLSAATGPLLEAARARVDRSEFDVALALLTRRERILDAFGDGPEINEQRLQGRLLRSATELWRGRYATVASTAEEVGTQARRNGWFHLVSEATLLEGLALLQLGQLDRAGVVLDRAFGTFERDGDSRGAGEALMALGRVAHGRGEFGDAEERYGEARAKFVDSGDYLGEAQTLNALGDLARDRADWDSALTFAEEALELFEHQNNAVGVADCVNDLAELNRLTGNLVVARQKCIDALRRYEAIGSEQAFDVQMNLAMVLADEGARAEARQLLEQTRERAETAELYGAVAQVCLLMLPLLVEANELELAWQRFETARSHAARYAVRGRDARNAVLVTASHVRSLGNEERAIAMEAFANERLR